MPMNYAKTALLLLALTGIFVAMGAVVGGTTGLVLAFIMALVMNAFSLWNADTMVLRLFKAREVDERSAPEYVELVRELAHRAELPMPRVYVIDNPQPNAFATGRSPARSAVAASTGLFNILSREELAGVLAHELAHIKNRDTLTMGVAATIGGAISMLAQYLQVGFLFGSANRDESSGPGALGGLVAMLVAPMLAMFVQMAISRSREYQADRLGSMICGNPLWLASALQKIHAAVKRIPNWQAERFPAAAHVFIMNPLNGERADNLFSTHPHVENRIAALEALARDMRAAGGIEWDIAAPGRPATSVPSTGPSRRSSASPADRRPWG